MKSICGAVVVSAIVMLASPPSLALDQPQELAFRDALLDAKTLAASEARVRVFGGYIGYNDSAEMLYPPDADIIGSIETVRLLTEDSPRVVRVFLYECRRRQRLLSRRSVCPLRVTGHFGECTLLASGVGVSCLYVEEIEYASPKGVVVRLPPPSTVASPPPKTLPAGTDCTTDAILQRAVADYNEHLSAGAPKLVSITDPKTKSANEKQIDCDGTGHFTDLERRPVTYSFWID